MNLSLVIQSLRKIIALSIMLVGSQTIADAFEFDTDKAYILASARVENQEAIQPTWIALTRGGRLLHVPADDLIIELEPGIYEISHIDFNKHKSLGYRTKFLESNSKLDLKAGQIFLVGEFLFTGKHRSNYELDYGDTVALIAAACKKSPTFFKHFPLRSPEQNKSVMVPCDGLAGEQDDVESQ